MSFTLIEATHQHAEELDCMCYCSFKCGPRYPDQPGDAPFIDPETGICFCQKRDQKAYFKHGCDKKNNAHGFKTCCESKYQHGTKRRFARTNYYKK